ncbi:unnamed protein product [Effrenium voratum]|uniref:Uncharacterized protein n=1 Tax=Effrenium voratum TaxID=2562239 RepID=A0AA36NC99_9DINO|nr:unnamed protein product [Effrenium voratum]
MASSFNRAFAAGRGSAKAKAGRGRGSQAAQAAAAEAELAKVEANEGKVTCANRALLQQMLSGALSEEEDAQSDEREFLSASMRNVNSQPQARGNVPTIRSPPSGRPGSRGGGFNWPGTQRRASLESQARPSLESTNGVRVTTGAPRPALVTYVSQPRPGSRGAGGSPTGEALSSPASQRWQKPTVRPAVQPKSGAPKAGPPSSYAGMHQARKPDSVAIATGFGRVAAKPRCGPSAFELVKKLQTQDVSWNWSLASMTQGVHGKQESEQDLAEAESGDDGFVMPPGSDGEASQQDDGSAFFMPDADYQDAEDSAADYVAQVKRDLGIEAQVTSREPRAPVAPERVPAQAVAQVPVHTAQARARSSDTRSEAAAPPQVFKSFPRSRSSDPRAHVAAARAYQSADSDDEEDDDDDEQKQGFQWKAGIRDMVKNFAQEERARQASPRSKPSSSPNTRKPPRAPLPSGPEREQRRADEEASKKPRAPVEYTPATVEDYKQRFGKKAEYSELGRLGPDLDDEGLLMKRAIQEKVKQFSKELHRVNKTRAEKVPPTQKAEPKIELQKGKTARDKAKEFAKNVPKPKPAPKQVVLTPSQQAEEEVQEKSQEAADWDEIRRRERQHFEDAARVADVRQFLARLAV